MNQFKDSNLIFVISQPRSGSTLLQLILSGHSEIATTSEPWLALHPVFALHENSINSVYNSALARKALKDFFQQSGMDNTFYKKQIKSFLLAFYQQAAGFHKKKFFLDKTPRYYHIIDDLIEIFPEAKFIILHRHPLAVLNSILKTWVKDDLTLLHNYKDDLLTAPKKLVNFVKNHPDQCCRVKYEDLVVNPVKIIKEMCGFLKIAYSDNMLDYFNRRNPDWNFGDTTGIHNSSKPSTSSLEKWKKSFTSPQEIHFARSYLKYLGPDLIDEMGYNSEDTNSLFEAPKEINTENIIHWSNALNHETAGELKYKVNKLIHENAALINERAILYNSRSWKITAPLRSAVKFIESFFDQEESK